MEILEEIKELLATIEVDLVKFYTKGNSTAGVRARATMQLTKDKLQELRKDTLSTTKKL